jgi:hypothetical protein
VGFRRITLPDGDRAAPVRRPGAVIVTDNGLALAVVESDLIGRGTVNLSGRLSRIDFTGKVVKKFYR